MSSSEILDRVHERLSNIRIFKGASMSGLENLACLLAASASGSEIFRALSYGALKFGKNEGSVHERF